ncbi:hypothetical protein CTA2_7587, partial [Colletotrichum tanaceti]
TYNGFNYSIFKLKESLCSIPFAAASLNSYCRISNTSSPYQASTTNWASPFQDPANIAKWGWVPYIQAPWHLDEAFANPEFPVDKSNNGIHRFSHEKDFKYDNSTKGQFTYAHYTNTINPRAGAFIFDSNFSPTYRRTKKEMGDVPDLNRMSDLAYFQWQDSCQATGVALNSLRVVFHAYILYCLSFDTIIEALRQEGHTKVPSWKDQVTFSMDSLGGLAILATAQGASTVWFLVQHREELGAKRITEVVVWGGKGEFKFPDLDTSTAADLDDVVLNLRFTITDA